MKLSELKSIIMECIEEMDEGIKRLDRLHNSNKQDSPSKEVRGKHDKDFHRAADKILRRNEKGIAKHGQVKFANARLHGKKPVEESGPADRYRKTHGKIQDTGSDSLKHKASRDSSGKLKSRVGKDTAYETPTKIVRPDGAKRNNSRIEFGGYEPTSDNRNRNRPIVYNDGPDVVHGKRAKRGIFKNFDKSAKHLKGNRTYYANRDGTTTDNPEIRKK